MKNGQNKYLLREVFKKYFSDDVIKEKQKSPRPGSNNFLMFNEYFYQLIDLLKSNKGKYSNYFDSRQVLETFINDKKKIIYH